MDVMNKSVLYYKKPLYQKQKPSFNDGRWSLPQQKQLIPRMKKRTLNPIKIKQIYQLKIKDQLMLQRHRKSSQSHFESRQTLHNRSEHVRSEPKQFRPKLFHVRIRDKSISNGLYIKMGDRAKHDMSYVNCNNHSWLKI